MTLPDDFNCRMRPMRAADLDAVLEWRNDVLVRRFMFTNHAIGMGEHLAWFERVSQDPSRYPLVFERDGLASGVVNFSVSGAGGVAEWGFYAAPQSPRGTGGQMGRTALRYGFATLGFHKISGMALALNAVSMRLHLGLGFRQEGMLREQHFDGRQYHDVVCFGLLASEWRLNDQRGEPE